MKRDVSTPLMHRIVTHGDTVYISGIVAEDLSQSTGGQTRQIATTLDKLLARAGADRTKLLSAQIYMTDMTAKSEMNAVWSEWLETDHMPTRATIGVADLGPGVLIEIIVTAAVG
ncbi:MAG: RidA family protein [Hyphomicrobiales bacterium]|nr:RidA family protein [Hyphomicrobiales bacterium]